MEYVDLTEEQVTKRQHYVPKAYLKEFSFDERNVQHVYAVFSNGKGAVSVSIDKICCQSYLYEQIAVDPHSGALIFAAPNELERFFSAIEGRYAAIVSKLKSDLREKNDFELEADEISAMKGFISLLLWRNPIFVHISNAIVNRLYAQNAACIAYLQKEFTDVPPNVVISYLAHDFLKRQLLIFMLALFDTMENSQVCIFKAVSSSFITSAMPVKNIYGEKNGLEYDLMGMPITPDLFLAFVDVESIIPKVVTIDENSVKRINSRHLGGRKNILISNKKDIYTFVDFSSSFEDTNSSWLYSVLSMDKETVIKQYEEIMNSKDIKYWR